MKYEKHVNQLLDYLSQETNIPKDKLHLINIYPEQLYKAISTLISKNYTIDKAVEQIKSIWHNSSPRTTIASEKEMVLLGYELVNEVWHHIKARVSMTELERLTNSFQYAEQKAIHGLAEQQKK